MTVTLSTSIPIFASASPRYPWSSVRSHPIGFRGVRGHMYRIVKFMSFAVKGVPSCQVAFSTMCHVQTLLSEETSQLWTSDGVGVRSRPIAMGNSYTYAQIVYEALRTPTNGFKLSGSWTAPRRRVDSALGVAPGSAPVAV